MAPPMLPKAKLIRDGVLPSKIWGNGVADETASGNAAFAIEPKATSIKTRAVIAGLTRLQPIPPKRHLTIIIAKTEPTPACQSGMFAGRLVPAIVPLQRHLNRLLFGLFLQ